MQSYVVHLRMCEKLTAYQPGFPGRLHVARYVFVYAHLEHFLVDQVDLWCWRAIADFSTRGGRGGGMGVAALLRGKVRFL